MYIVPAFLSTIKMYRKRNYRHIYKYIDKKVPLLNQAKKKTTPQTSHELGNPTYGIH